MVGLQWLVVLVNVGVGMGVVTASGDGVVVVVEVREGHCWELDADREELSLQGIRHQSRV